MSSRILIVSVTIAGLFLTAAAVIRSVGDVAAARETYQDTIGFTGTAERIVESDRMKWSVQLTRTANSLKTAEEQLSADRNAMLALLKDRQIPTTDVSVQPLSSTTDFYSKASTANQVIVIESDAIGPLTSFQGEAASAMAARGGSISTLGNEFTFSALNDVQKELAREALEDVKHQAEQVPGARIGKLQNAGNATFSVAPVNSSPSYYGYNGYGTAPETQSVKKKITATMYATYHVN